MTPGQRLLLLVALLLLLASVSIAWSSFKLDQSSTSIVVGDQADDLDLSSSGKEGNP